MKRKKPKLPPATVVGQPRLELKPVPAAPSREFTPEPKFIPPVSLSYESTLELKPIPAPPRRPKKKPQRRAQSS